MNFLLTHHLHHLFTFLMSQVSDDNPDFSNLTKTVLTWINALIIPVSVIIGGMSIYKLMALGWKIAHSADRPDERKIAVMGVCWWGLGLILCITAPILVNVLMPILLKSSSGHYDPTNMILSLFM